MEWERLIVAQHGVESWHLHGLTEEKITKDFRIVGMSARIRTGHCGVQEALPLSLSVSNLYWSYTGVALNSHISLLFRG